MGEQEAAAAPAAASAAGSGKDAASTEPSAVAGPGAEVVERRTRFSRTLLEADGTFTAEVSPEPVHFRDGAGRWLPIDSSLVPRAGGDFSQRANDFEVLLPASLSAPVRVARGGVWASLQLRGAAGQASVSGVTARYAEALPGEEETWSSIMLNKLRGLGLKRARHSTTPDHLSLLSRIGELPDDAIEGMLFDVLINSESLLVRRQAVEELAKRNPDRVPDPILQALGIQLQDGSSIDPSDIVKYGLARIRALNGVTILANALRDKNLDRRFLYVIALGDLQDPAADTILVDALQDEDEWVRLYAARALGIRGDQSAVRALRSIAGDESRRVRRQVRDAIRSLEATNE
ncbi:MAG: HEAT repeat domain-containing protein [Gaiellaceae bacterium]